MVFIESSSFTKLLPSYLTDEEYSSLQVFLIIRPDAGDTIRGTGGLRKMRWAGGGHGKRGGLRIIYYWLPSHSRCYLATLYAKGEVSDLTMKQRRLLKEQVKRWQNEQA